MYLCFAEAKSNLQLSPIYPGYQYMDSAKTRSIIVEFHYMYPSTQGTCSEYRLFSTKD